MKARAGTQVLAVVAIVVASGFAGATAHAADALTVSAVPSTGLVGGQSITVTVTGAVPSAAVVVGVCPAGAAFFIDQCDDGAVGLGFATAEGTFTAQLTVHTTFTRALDPPVDCRVAPGTCVIGAGDNPDGGPLMEAPLTFAAAPPPSTAPPVTPAPTTAMRTSTTVTAVASAAQPRFTG